MGNPESHEIPKTFKQQEAYMSSGVGWGSEGTNGRETICGKVREDVWITKVTPLCT